MIHEAAGRRLGRIGLVRTFAGVLAAFLFFLLAIAALHYYADYRAERARRETNESLNVELARHAVTADIAAVLTDLRFLARHMERLSFDTETAVARRSYLTQVFVTFAREKNLYDQVRFIDADGREVVRVNHNGGRPEAVPEERLQDKSARYYFQQSRSLEPGGIYISPLDLNVEDGRIETPYKPVMRFVAPVDDAEGNRRGLLVLNYLGERLVDSFRRAAANIADHVQLLNDDGYWLSGPHPDDEWGFMFGRDLTFGGRFPEAWKRISASAQGQFIAPDGLFTFATVVPGYAVTLGLGGEGPALPMSGAWKVVSHLPATAVAASPAEFIHRHAALYLSLLGLLALTALLLASAHVHRRVAESQREYERRFRQTLEDANLAAVMVDASGRVNFCNSYLLALIGAPREEVVGSDWVEQFVPAEQREQVGRVLRRLGKAEGFPERFEGEIETRNGDRRLIAWNNTLARDERGRVLGVTGIGEDVTDQRRAAEQVRKLSQAVEQSPSIVIITDPAGRIEYVNPKFTEVTGYRRDEVKGRNPRFLKSGETSPEDYQKLWSTINRGNEWRGEFHNRRKNGELYWEAASISALRDEAGTITHFLAVKEDITGRKRLEQEVEAQHRELARAQTLAELGRIATEIAHDLRNPLSSVKMSLQILGKKATDDDSLELGRIGIEQVRYMEDIINDMLVFARPGAPTMDWLTIDKVLDAAVTTVRRRIEDAGVEVEVACAAGLPTFPGDGRRLRQMLVNLIVNAIQAVERQPPGARRVEIQAGLALGEGGSAIRITICDNGPGIEEDIREHLFEPFFTTRSKGTGLGLSIVRQIADQHHASVALLPYESRGTCAQVLLPVAPAVELVDEEQSGSING